MLAKISYVLLLIFFWVESSATFAYSAELIDKIVAIVNGEIITQRELEQGKFLNDGKWEIEDAIDICILTQEAEKKGIPEDSKVIEEHLSAIEKEHSKEWLEAVLRQGNVTLAEYKEWLRKGSLRNGLISWKRREINEEIRVQEAEVNDFYLRLKRYLDGFSDSEKGVKEFYQIYQKELEEIEKVKIAHFIVKDEGEANAIKQKLEQGENLKQGREYAINLGDIDKSIRDTIVSLEIGQVSKIEMKGDDSFWVIQLKERKELLYSEYKDQMESYLKNKKGEESLQAWIKELREKAEVRII
jgi:peptidyl-prolyl cis-trans isomerase SurA